MAELEQEDDDKEPVVRQLRVSSRLWRRFGEVAGLRGRSGVLVSFIRWYVRDADAKLPRRPDPPKEKPAPDA